MDLPQYPSEIVNPDLGRIVLRITAVTLDAASRKKLRVDWVGKTLALIVEEAIALKGLSVRQAGKLTGLPYQMFVGSYWESRHPSPETVAKMSEGLDLPVDVLSVRAHRLPPGAENDIVFQDKVVRAWRKHNRSKP